MWKEVIVTSIEMNADVGGCREGETRWKFDNSGALVAQRTLMI
jgi:hypothetical protein